MMMAVVAPVPLDDTTTIDTEIADMMSEISAIIHPATVAIALPAYPRQMSIYDKSIAFTPTEITSRTGASLTSYTIDTITDTALLRKKITSLIGSDQII
jgi:putative effector of murein hydrolase